MKKPQNKSWALIAIISTTISILSLGYWSHKLFSRNPQNLSTPSAVEIPQKKLALPVHISVGNLVDIPIESFLVEDDSLPVSDIKATFTLNSSKPGEAGNTIIYGHNSNQIFGRMRLLKGGERVVITTDDDQQHEYYVVDVQEYSLDQIDPLHPTNEEILTLYTCAGFFDSKRLVVQAVPRAPSTKKLEDFQPLVTSLFINTSNHPAPSLHQFTLN